ncbi:MAG: Gfo/Idh/MocA family oxidoreductase [Myxococcota bacterium]
MTGIGVVGCGYWGPNLVRNFNALVRCELRAICDIKRDQLEPLARRFPAATTYTRFEDLVADPSVDAIAICTPVGTHYRLASAALAAGKHVLVEKPLTDSVETAERLVNQAKQAGLVLAVDHTFVYSGAVQKIRSIIDTGALGEPLYIDSVRINLGLFQSDINVVWDLAPHDVSVIQYLIDRMPKWVSAIGTTHYGKLENQAYITLQYENSFIAHLHVNWLAPVKLRSTVIGGSKKMIVYNDLAPSEQIQVYEKGVTMNADHAERQRALVDYRVGDMHAPYIEKYEPLERVCTDFIDAIERGSATLTDGRAGLEVVHVLEAAQKSIHKDGERIHIGPDGD